MDESSREASPLQNHLSEEKGDVHDDTDTDPTKDPLKFIFGVIFDQGIQWERAWRAPSELEKRLGHLEITKIAHMKQADLEEILLLYPALHRMNAKLAGWLISACRLLIRKYDGKPEKIWEGSPTAHDLEDRFREFSGIGQKKGSMAVNILVRDYEIPIKGTKSGIDISYDIHVRRVFLRTGLASRDTEDEVLSAARSLAPEYPGALDHPAWLVGMKWCHRTNPECGTCALSSTCPKISRNVQLL